jgi:hypothetical protein
MAELHGDQISLAVSDLSYMAFLWLLRLGECCSSTESHLFRLCDLQLFIGNDRLDPFTCALADLGRVTFVTLTFTSLNNCVRGEGIGHARSRHLYACPVWSALSTESAASVSKALLQKPHYVPYVVPHQRPDAPFYPGSSQKPSAPQRLVSMPTMSQLAPVVPVAPWPCSVAVSTPVSFNLLVVGARMCCFYLHLQTVPS